MFDKSMVSIAYTTIAKHKRPVPFVKLYREISKVLELSEADKAKYISSFYTQLTLDGRFLNVGDNAWDLRARHTSSESQLDINEAYKDDEEEEEVAEIGEIAKEESKEEESEDEEDSSDDDDEDDDETAVKHENARELVGFEIVGDEDDDKVLK
jgi:DNA-directed RNA polymerase subunit delta